MLVGQWMTRDPVTVGPDDPLHVPAEIMGRRNIRRLPVLEHGALVGIITKSDVLRACPADFNPFSAEAMGAGSLTVPVRKAMTTKPLTVRPETPIEIAAQLMTEHKVGALPVVADGLQGIVTASDLFRALSAALGGGGPGLRITFDLSESEDAVHVALELSRRHHLKLASIWTYSQDEHRIAIVRLMGPEPSGLVDDLWKTGHRVLSVLRLT